MLTVVRLARDPPPHGQPLGPHLTGGPSCRRGPCRLTQSSHHRYTRGPRKVLRRTMLAGFSPASRSTRSRISWPTGGRPGRFGKEGEERTVDEVAVDGTDASEG